MQALRSNKDKKIAIVGNPNVGKSVFFSLLTKKYQEISNFPGTTVEVTTGKWDGFILIDTPGIYGLSAMTDEERAVRDIVLDSHLVINVVNAVNPHRDFFLTRQLIDAGIPLVVVLNFTDEMEKFNLEIDVSKLEELLGVPAISTVAVEKKGLRDLEGVLKSDGGSRGRQDKRIAAEVEAFAREKGLNSSEALFILEGDRELARRRGLEAGECRDRFYQMRRETVNEIVDQVVWEVDDRESFKARLGYWLLNPLTGFPILAITLWIMYRVVGVWVAQDLVGLTEGVLMQEYYQPAVRRLVENFLHPGGALEALLVGRFGVLTMAVTYVFGLLLPLVLGFFFMLSLLEDSGYLPRIAILLDRATGYLGLNGRAIIPLILGLGCVTMAAITTRLLDSRRERRIAIFLLALAVPCSAQLAFVTAVLARLGPGYLILYAIIILSVLVVAGSLLGKVLPGFTTPLLVDLPSLQLPRVENVTVKTWNRTYNFIKEAIPLFFGGALLLGILEVTGMLQAIEVAMYPLTAGWLGLPGETADAFIMGFIRRDFGTAGIMTLGLQPLQEFVALVTLTLFVPCIASTMVIFKELGWKDAVLIWPSVFVIAFTVGGLVARLLQLFHGPWMLYLSTAAVILVLVAALSFTRVFETR